MILRAIPALRSLADSIEKALRSTSGCVATKLDTTRTLIEVHAKGFKDAVNASPESRLFVKDALRVIVNLEERIENGE